MKSKLTLSFLAVATAVSFVACTQSDQGVDTRTETETQDTTLNSDTSINRDEPGRANTETRETETRQVIPQDSMQGTDVRRGETELKVKEKVVKRETETKSESVPTVEHVSQKADLNRMDSKDFLALGFPKKMADQIVSYRDKNGEFRSVDDLSKVPGMDVNMLNRFRDKLSVGPVG